MKINRIIISKLYNQFSYDIDFLKTEGNLTILTGPNGYGKTTVLQIIDSLSKGDFVYFYTFPFEIIEVFFDNKSSLEICRLIVQANESDDEDETIEKISFLYKDEEQKFVNKFELKIQDVLRFIPSSIKQSLELHYSYNFSINDLHDVIKNHPELKIYENIAAEQKQEQFLLLIGNFKSFFIPAQRLYFIEKEREYRRYNSDYYGKKSSIDEVIELMKDQLQSARFTYLRNAQNHDNQFLNKYLSFSGKIYDEKDFKIESEKLQQVINELYSYRLIDKIVLLEYVPEHKKILSVYLNDLSEKLDLYTDFLSKLRIFSDILKEKMFTNKQISFSPEYGIIASLEDGTDINLNSLSSGEKNEIIMLYHLIFDVKDNSVLLIDEPEISLHVAWQLDFLKDIEKILEKKKNQVIIATHSPQIINDKWDYCFDFYEHNNK